MSDLVGKHIWFSHEVAHLFNAVCDWIYTENTGTMYKILINLNGRISHVPVCFC